MLSSLHFNRWPLACAAAAVALVLGVPGRASAESDHCDLVPQMVTYWTDTPQANSLRCDWEDPTTHLTCDPVTTDCFKAGFTPTCSASGWLWKNAAVGSTTGKLPLVIVIHGSGGTPSDNYFCPEIHRFVDNGYLVFMPYMRGDQDTTGCGQPTIGQCVDPSGIGFRNTGKVRQDYIDETGGPNATADTKASLNIDYLLKESRGEIKDALSFISAAHVNGPFSPLLVDPAKIALMGHSFGGSHVVIAASLADLSPMPAATVDLSGGVLSWAGSQNWQLEMMPFAMAHQMPIYMQQSTLEYALTQSNNSPTQIVDPTVKNFLAAQGVATATNDAQMAVWSSDHDSVCDGKATPGEIAHCYHSRFLLNSTEVDRWWPTALNFLVRHGVK